MKAYKFLLPGAVGPFSGFAWPAPDDDRPGPWVDGAGDELARCRAAVHACRVQDLPWWIQPELWAVELVEPVRQVRHKLFAPRGRLLARCERWDAARADAFAWSCAVHAAAHAAGTLEALGETASATALRSAEHPAVLDAVARRLRVPEAARIGVTMAADAARRAQGGHPATAAYISAHAAHHAGGEAAMVAERRRQSGWLAEQVALER